MSALGNMAFASMGAPVGAILDPDFVLTTADPAGNYAPPAANVVKLGVAFGVDEVGTLPVPVLNAQSADSAMLQRNQQSLFRSKCCVGVYTDGAGHDPTAGTWAYGAEMICGFKTTPPTETADGADVTITDGELRIMPGILIRAQDRIKLTMVDLEELTTPEYYAVVGAPTAGIAATRARVKRITGGSVL